jgi:hypothetical protein
MRLPLQTLVYIMHIIVHYDRRKGSGALSEDSGLTR